MTLILLTGCSRNVEKPPESTPVVQEAPQKEPEPETKPGRKRTLTLTENAAEEKAGEPAPVSQEPAQSSPLYQGRESLLYEQITNHILPEDFLIGPLQGDHDTDRDSEEIVEKVTQFFSSLGEKKIDSLQLHPDWRTIITRSLTIPQEEYAGFNHFRLGAIMSQETSARMNVRLFTETGRTEGEVFLEKEGGTWYISDVQIELSMLLEEYIPEGEFEPSTYRWLETY
jgi:hypothetical protein